MKQFQKIALTVFAGSVLAGCSGYSDALDQKLSGKSVTEKHTILAQECGIQIKAGLKKDNPANVRHSEKMKQICEEMTGKRINLK